MIFTITKTASNYDAQDKLEEAFIQALEKEVIKGARVISIVRDDTRIKKAYLEVD